MIDNRRASECSIVNEPAVSIGKGILFSFCQRWEQDTMCMEQGEQAVRGYKQFQHVRYCKKSAGTYHRLDASCRFYRLFARFVINRYQAYSVHQLEVKSVKIRLDAT